MSADNYPLQDMTNIACLNTVMHIHENSIACHIHMVSVVEVESLHVLRLFFQVESRTASADSSAIDEMTDGENLVGHGAILALKPADPRYRLARGLWTLVSVRCHSALGLN